MEYSGVACTQIPEPQESSPSNSKSPDIETKEKDADKGERDADKFDGLPAHPSSNRREGADSDVAKNADVTHPPRDTLTAERPCEPIFGTQLAGHSGNSAGNPGINWAPMDEQVEMKKRQLMRLRKEKFEFEESNARAEQPPARQTEAEPIEYIQGQEHLPKEGETREKEKEEHMEEKEAVRTHDVGRDSTKSMHIEKTSKGDQRLREMLQEWGHDDDFIQQRLQKRDDIRKLLEMEEEAQDKKGTWLKIRREDILSATVIAHELPWTWAEDDPDYIIIQRWLSNDFLAELYEHTRCVRDGEVPAAP
ncbi:hypothetical protein N7466_007332 [Penicillium verhagenii]|uniref:uncharacterized protein n=1 Tax=Penicillium verhagenii TaxID=1562060 RepID=UPI002544EFE9|nr:uncharacterized protein N7466_007332 [Penicillium verhagenii]KAJ5928376.1 hypothetical protein N7466_007332 [Penicillium verhagenii]